MTRIIGYLRPNMDGEDVPIQLKQLKAAGATKIFREQPAGTKRDRPQFDKLMAGVRYGDTVVVTSLDRIARNTRHLLEIIDSLNANGVIFKVIDGAVDTSSPQWQVVRTLLVAITDFERKVVHERQAEGIDKAKRKGRYKGRKPTARAKTAEVLTLNARGLTRQKIADQLGIGVASVYRILKDIASAEKIDKKPLQKPADKQKRVERKPKHEPPAEQLSFF